MTTRDTLNDQTQQVALSVLGRLKEAELQKRVIEPLLDRLDFKLIRDFSGAGEHGFDLIAFKTDLGKRILYGIQIKRFKLTGKQSSPRALTGVLNQLRQILKSKAIDPHLQNEVKIHNAVFITPFAINRPALESAFDDVMEHDHHGIFIIDGPLLVNLLQEKLSPLLKELCQKQTSSDRLRPHLNTIRELSAFSPAREILLEDIFVDVFFHPRSRLANILQSRSIANVGARLILCQPKELEDLSHGTLFAGIRPVILGVTEDKRAKLFAEESGRLTKTLSDLKSTGTRRDKEDCEQKLRELHTNIVASLNIDSFITWLNEQILSIKAQFRHIQQQNFDPSLVRQVFSTGGRLMALVSRIVENAVIAKTWPELGFYETIRSKAVDLTCSGAVLRYIELPLIVFGPPGAGKTTMLRWLALNDVKSKSLAVPLFVYMSNVRSATLKALYDECEEQLVIAGSPVSRATLRRNISLGRYRLFLDGLDEMGANATDMLDVIMGLSQKNDRLRLVVSSRDNYRYSQWSNALSIRLLPFADDQVSAFVKKWFASTPTLGTRVTSWLKKCEAVRDIARTPLILAVLCSLAEANVDLPANECHRSLQNQPVRVESKPATPRCLIHIRFLDAGNGLFNFFILAGAVLQPTSPTTHNSQGRRSPRIRRRNLG